MAAASVLIALLGCSAASAEPEPWSATALSACGKPVAAPPDAPFRTEDAWHGLAQCLRQMRNVWGAHGPLAKSDLPGGPTITDVARAQIVSEMSSGRASLTIEGAGREPKPFGDAFGPNLQPIRPVALAWVRNTTGGPYNGMGQTGLAYFLYAFSILAKQGGYDGAEADAVFYRTLARAAVRTVLTPVEDGGLKSTRACDSPLGPRCSWYHSITRRDLRSSAGGTLNQMLHVLRDLGLMADLDTAEDADVRARYEAAVKEGLAQLFYGRGRATPDDIPNLGNYQALDGSGRAFYGMDLKAPSAQSGYFLGAPGRDCSYQIHVLQLMSQILDRAAKHDVKTDSLQCSPALLNFFASAKSAIADHAPNGMNCTPDSGKPFSQVSTYYAPKMTDCPR